MKTQRTVRNCVPEFRFRCPKSWDQLTATTDAAVRYCETCKQSVYFCNSDEETLRHAKAGHCIAREIPDESELPMSYVGQPEFPTVETLEQKKASEWANREWGIDDSIKNAIGSSHCCPNCGFPAPDWRKTCRVCGLEMGRVQQNEVS